MLVCQFGFPSRLSTPESLSIHSRFPYAVLLESGSFHASSCLCQILRDVQNSSGGETILAKRKLAAMWHPQHAKAAFSAQNP